MFLRCRRSELTTRGRIGKRFSRLSGKLAATGWVTVTVLLLFLVGEGTTWGEDANSIKLRVFEFSSRFQLPMAPGRLDGVMASDGLRHRISVYWIEPHIYREGAPFLRCADVILTPKTVRYWVYGMTKAQDLPLLGDAKEPLLPRASSAEAVARSALAITSQNAGVSLDMGKFFRDSRGRDQYTSEKHAAETDINSPTSPTASDIEIMNALPYGREYRKTTRPDGTLVWGMRRALGHDLLTTVTIKPVEKTDGSKLEGVFDPNTLGQWALVPEPYRVYWSFDDACAQLSKLADKRSTSRRLFDKIGSYLADSNAPPQVCRGLDRLRFDVALATGDSNCVWLAVQAAATGLREDRSVSSLQCLVQLGGMSGKIDKLYPQGAEERLRPFVAQMVKSAGADFARDLDMVMQYVNANKWLTYGQLVLEEARQQTLVSEDALSHSTTKLEGTRLARDRRSFDPCEATPSVRKYLAQLDVDPPRGALDMNGVRQVLEDGLAKQFRDSDPDAKRKIVEDVTRSIRLIVGDGPFTGDPAKLAEAVEQFDEVYFPEGKVKGPLDSTLATFLALSFCDTSTAEDHDLLLSQFEGICTQVQTRVLGMLTSRELDSLIGLNDVAGLFYACEETLQRTIADPLWPQFKFPLTPDEQNQLLNKMKSQLAQAEPSLDEVSLKVKYGGPNADLKKKAMAAISTVVQQVIPGAAILRSPPYPGISSRNRGARGFTTIAPGFYDEGGRAKEIFKAMKYFHLGHRLEETVIRERERVLPMRNSPRQEVPTDDAAR